MGFLPQMGAGGAVGFLSGGNTPQDWGQGIQNAPFTPYNTGPGIQPGQVGVDPNFNFSGPGAGETYFGQNQGRFNQPTAASGFYGQAQTQYGKRPELSNNSQTEYNNLNRPNLSQGPGLDPYYAHARERLAGDINNQYGSRGMFGSSAALNGLQQGFTGLAAEQANREADFKLRQIAEDRAWAGLGGQLAGQADANSRASSQNELGWLMGLGGLAQNADQSNLAQLMGGMDAASTAQNLMRNRGQDYFNNVMGPTLALAQMSADTYGDMLGYDAQAMNNALMLESGLAQAALQGSLYNQQRQKSDAEWAKGMLGGGKGKGGK